MWVLIANNWVLIKCSITYVTFFSLELWNSMRGDYLFHTVPQSMSSLLFFDPWAFFPGLVGYGCK